MDAKEQGRMKNEAIRHSNSNTQFVSFVHLSAALLARHAITQRPIVRSRGYDICRRYDSPALNVLGTLQIVPTSSCFVLFKIWHVAADDFRFTSTSMCGQAQGSLLLGY